MDVQRIFYFFWNVLFLELILVKKTSTIYRKLNFMYMISWKLLGWWFLIFFRYFFTSILGEVIQFTHIFQMGLSSTSIWIGFWTIQRFGFPVEISREISRWIDRFTNQPDSGGRLLGRFRSGGGGKPKSRATCCSRWVFWREGISSTNRLNTLVQPVNPSSTIFLYFFGQFLVSQRLAGGFKYFVFSPLLGERIPFWRAYFSEGLKPPTRLRWNPKNSLGFGDS